MALVFYINKSFSDFMCISLHGESNSMLAGSAFQKVPEISGDEVVKVGERLPKFSQIHHVS